MSFCCEQDLARSSVGSGSPLFKKSIYLYEYFYLHVCLHTIIHAWCLQRPEEGMDPLKQINNKNVKKKSKNIKISKRKMT